MMAHSTNFIRDPDLHKAYCEWLKKVRLLQDIKGEDGAIEHLLGVMTEVRYHSEATILQDGHQGDEAYFLLKGKVKVLKTTSADHVFPVALLDAADHPFFGEAALLENDKRSATIRCTTDCECLVLKRADFEAFCLHYPQWALPIVRKIGCVVHERLQRANSDMALLYTALVNEVKGWNG